MTLLDAERREVDLVRYADDGAWPAAADGQGPALELLDPDSENESPAAWRASERIGGSPGAGGLDPGAAPPPRIDLASHHPTVPREGKAVTVQARITPEPATAFLLWRIDGEEPFQSVAMEPAGAFRAAVVPPAPEGTLIEYAIEAELPAAEGGEPRRARWPPGEPGTALLEFDRFGSSPLLPTYRLLLRAKDVAGSERGVRNLYPGGGNGSGAGARRPRSCRWDATRRPVRPAPEARPIAPLTGARGGLRSFWWSRGPRG